MAVYRNMIVKALKGLESYGFVVHVEREDEAHFGDTVATAQGSDIKVRMIADRGQYFCDVALHGSHHWKDLHEFIPNADAGPWKTPDIAVQSIVKHLREIKDKLAKM